jgi:putative oxidoreductase
MISRFTPFTLAVLRILAAFIFFQFGAQKVLGLFGGMPAERFSPLWFGGAIELLGSIALALGWLTRPVAALLALNMAAVYAFTHLPNGLLPISSNRVAEETFLLLLISALLAVVGPGKFSVEGALKKTDDSGWEKYPNALGVFRLLTGLVFMSHGLEKLFGIGGNPQVFLTLRWFAGVFEFFGGVGLALGLFTAPVAFIICGEMAVAYFMSHNSRGFFPVENNGIRAFLFCFMFFFIMTAGAGKFSLDGILSRKERIRPQVAEVPSR